MKRTTLVMMPIILLITITPLLLNSKAREEVGRAKEREMMI
jgi:hypothetical protein